MVVTIVDLSTDPIFSEFQTQQGFSNTKKKKKKKKIHVQL